MTARPRIAIPADTLTEATNIINERNAPFAPKPVIEAIVKSNGLPVILPSVSPELAAQYLPLFDGVLFAGGFDVDPTFFGEEPHEKLGSTYLKRDLFEMALLKEALRANKAVMGICRGMQVINAGLGGTLYQDLSENPDAYLKHTQAAMGNMPSHHVTTKENSRVNHLIGTRPYVNSRHHQAVKKLGDNLVATAFADDGVVEAIESADSDQILAVQWHPENMFKHYKYSQALFADLIKRAQERMN